MRASEGGKAVGFPLGGMVLLLAAVEAWVRLRDVPPYVFVPVTDIVEVMVERHHFFVSATVVTAKEILIGFAAAVVIGVPLALAIDAWPRFERRIYPFLLTSQVTPQIAFVPIIVMWFGFGLKAKIVVVFLFTLFPIVLDTLAGLRSTDPGVIHLARSIGAGRIAILLKIKLPGALPNVFVGLKIAATLAVIGAVVAEFIGASEGLGTVILAASGNLEIATMLAAVAYLTLIGVAFFFIIDALERVALPWHVSQRSRRGTTR